MYLDLVFRSQLGKSSSSDLRRQAMIQRMSIPTNPSVVVALMPRLNSSRSLHQRCLRNRLTDMSRGPSNLFLLLKQENSFRSSCSAPIGMNKRLALTVSAARNSSNPTSRQKSSNPFHISTSSALRLNSSFHYFFAIPKGKRFYTTREKLFKVVESVFQDVEHWFLGVDRRFHAQEQQNHLRLKQNSSSNQKILLRLVEQRQAIAEGEEDVGGLAECLGFTPLGVSHRGLESAVAVQDVVPTDADIGTFAFEEPVIGSE